MEDLYRDNLLDHYENPRHHGTLEHPDISHEESNPLCGDEIRVDLKLNDDHTQIAEIAFSGDGCIISQTTACRSWTARISWKWWACRSPPHA